MEKITKKILVEGIKITEENKDRLEACAVEIIKACGKHKLTPEETEYLLGSLVMSHRKAQQTLKEIDHIFASILDNAKFATT